MTTNSEPAGDGCVPPGPPVRDRTGRPAGPAAWPSDVVGSDSAHCRRYGRDARARPAGPCHRLFAVGADAGAVGRPRGGWLDMPFTSKVEV
jgi:hypothetical protein